MRKRRQNVIVEILSDKAIGPTQAKDMVHNWLETFGHTACTFGFDFVSVISVPNKGKRLSKAPSLSNERA